MKKLSIFTMLFLVVFFASAGLAAVPPKINYEGRLTDASGSALSGSYNMRFSITSDLAGNNVVWGPEAHNAITVSNGVFAIILGDTTPITTNEVAAPGRYLKIEIANPPASTNFEALTPNSQIVSVAYALKAAEADNVAGGYVSQIVAGSNVTISPSSGTGAVTINSTGGGGGTTEVKYDNVSIGVNTAGSLEVKDNGITTPKIADNAVTTPKISNEAVTEPKLAVANTPVGSRYLHWNGSGMEWAVVTTAGTSEPDNITIGLNVNGSLEVINGGITAAKLAPDAAVLSLATVEGTRIKGNVDLKPGTNIILSQAGQTIEIAASGRGSGWIRSTGKVTLEAISDQVGIGTAEPAARLDVNGNIQISSGNALKYNGVNLAFASTATRNYFYGNAGNKTMTGFNNTGIGLQALSNNTSGSDNVAVGYVSLTSNTTGIQNTANGVGALGANTDGFDNVAVGYGALSVNTTAGHNTAVGFQAGFNSVGSDNVFLGYEADTLTTEASSVNAIAIGKGAKVGGSNMMVLGGTGEDAVNVGIGTSTPEARLTVAGTIEMLPGSGGGIKFTDGTIQTSAAGAGLWAPNASDIYNTNSGNVGIGTTEPTADLHIQRSTVGGFPGILVQDTGANSGAGIAFKSPSTDGGMFITPPSFLSPALSNSTVIYGGFGGSNGNISLFTTTEGNVLFYSEHLGPIFRMIVTGDGVGIGTSEPSSKLTVNGTIEMTPGSGGGIKFTDGTIQTTAANAGSFVRKTGDTMTGPLTIEGTPNPLTATGSFDTTPAIISLTNTGINPGDPLAAAFLLSNGTDGFGMGILNTSAAPLAGGGFFQADKSLNLIASSSEGINFGETTNAGPNFTMRLINGNLGIGSWEPSSRLTVFGTIEISADSGGGVRFADGSIQTTAAVSGGTVTRVDSGNGLTGGPITTAGTLELAKTITISGSSDADNFGIVFNNSGSGSPITSFASLIGVGNGTGFTYLGARSAGAGGGNIVGTSGDLMILTGTTNSVAFAQQQAGPVPPAINMVLNGQGDLGIGTTEPFSKLTVAGTIETTLGGIKFPDNSIQTSASGANLWSQNGSNIYNNNSGNVGIGTTEPQATLDVGGALLVDAPNGSTTIISTSEGNLPLGIIKSAANSDMIMAAYISNNSKGPAFRFAKIRGSFATPLAVNNGDSLGFTGYEGYDGTNQVQRAGIGVQAAENWSVGANGTSMDFSTTANGSALPAVRLTINDSGNVGIGTTEPQAKLHIQTDSAAPMIVRNTSSDAVSEIQMWNDVDQQASLFTAGSTLSIPPIAQNSCGIAAVSNQNLLFIASNGQDIRFADNLNQYSLVIKSNGLTEGGSVGIGSAEPGSRLTVAGTIETTAGGVKFPDGTVQITAAGSGELPPGASGQTLRHNGSNWIANSFLTNTGTGIGIGTTDVQSVVNVYSESLGGATEMRITNPKSSSTNGAAVAFENDVSNGGVGLPSSASADLLGNRLTMITPIPGHASLTPSGGISLIAYDVNGDVRLFTGGETSEARMIVASNGNVGIGTPEPQAKLHIEGDLKVTGTIEGASPVKIAGGLNVLTGNVGIGSAEPGSKLTVAGTIETIAGGVKFPDGSTQLSAFTGTATPDLQAVCDQGYTTSTPLTITSAGTGSVNFYSFAGGVPLAILQTETDNNLSIYNGYIRDNDQGPINLYIKGRGSFVTAEAVLGNDSLGMEVFGGVKPGPDMGFGAGIGSFATENWASDSTPGALGFFTVPSGSTDPAFRMIISSNGNVGIGTTDATSALTVGGTIEITADSGGGVKFADGTIQTSATGANLWSTSAPDKIYNTNTGPVGIGTAEPHGNYKLVVRDINNTETTLGRGFDIPEGASLTAIKDDMSAHVPLEFRASKYYFFGGGPVCINTTSDATAQLVIYGDTKLHTATDQNFLMRAGVDVPDAVSFTTVNDANNLNIPIEFRGGKYYFFQGYGNGTVGIGVITPEASLHIQRDEFNLVGVQIDNTRSNPGEPTNTARAGVRMNNDAAAGEISVTSSKYNNPVAWANSLLLNSGGKIDEVPTPGKNIVLFAASPEGNVAFYTGNDRDNLRLIIAANGNVGIGSSEPASLLTVAGTIETTLGGVKFPDGTIQTSANGAGLWAPNGDKIYNTNLGNVGIGTMEPQSSLEVNGTLYVDTANQMVSIGKPTDPTLLPIPLTTVREGDGALPAIGNFYYGNSPAIPPAFLAIRSHGTYAAPTETQADDILGGFYFGGRSTTTYNLGAGMSALAPANWDDSSTPARLTFTTTPIGSSQAEQRMIISENGNVGVGTVEPVATLEVEGSILSEGEIGGTPVSGGGTRFMWIPEHAALRAGSIANDEWDNANIGDWSLAIGKGVRASGEAAVALGKASQADGTVAIALGSGAIAAADHSVAIGDNVNANIPYTMAVGFGGTEPILFASGEAAGGAVGIGTTAPTSKLTVAGTIEIGAGTGGGVKFADSTIQTTAFNGLVGGGWIEGGGRITEETLSDYVVIGTTEANISTDEVAQLQLYGNNANPYGIRLANASNGNSAGAQIMLQNDQGDVGGIVGLSSAWDGGGQGITWGAGSSAMFSLPGHKLILSANGGDDIWLTNKFNSPAPNLIIKGDNVGIGTANPGATFEVAGTFIVDAASQSTTIFSSQDANPFTIIKQGAGSINMISAYIGENSSGPATFYLKARGTDLGSIGPVQAGDSLGYQVFGGIRSLTSDPGFSSSISAQATENWADSAAGSNLTFGTTPNGSITTEVRMTIANNGNVGIGTQEPAANLHVEGNLKVTGTIEGASPVKVAGGLNVSGTIETTGGIVFPDSSVQTSASGAGLWAPSGTDIYNTNSGNAGVGTTEPAAKLDISSDSSTAKLEALFPKGFYTDTFKIMEDTPSNYYGLYLDTNSNNNGRKAYGIYLNNDNSSGSPDDTYGIYSRVGQAIDTAKTYGIYSEIDEGTGNTAEGIAVYGKIKNPGTNRFAALFEGGNVGIGTAEPSAMLDVAGGVKASGTIETSAAVMIGNGTITGNNRLQINTGSTIPNTSVSSSLLEIDSESGDMSDINMRLSQSSTIAYPALYFSRSRGTLAAPTPVINNDIIGETIFQGCFLDGFFQKAASIRATVDGTPRTDRLPSKLSFYTVTDLNSVTGEAPVERLTIRNTGNVGIGTTEPGSRLTVNDSIEVVGSSATVFGPKFKFTPEGGYAIKLTNKTGAASVKGMLVKGSTANDNAFVETATSDELPIGAVYEAGVADGSDCWVVVSGIAEVLLENGSGTTNRGGWVGTSATAAGRAITLASSPGNTVEHFREIGHCLESQNAGSNVLCKIVMHFN